MNNSTAVMLILMTVVFSGCISHEETVYREVERMTVEFENDTAGRLFYETLSRQSAGARRVESKTEVALPIVFGHKRQVVTGENVRFNDAVRRCDTNQDGKVTELEARIFAGQKP